MRARRRFDLLTLRRAISLWGDDRQGHSDSTAVRRPESKPQSTQTTKPKTNPLRKSRGAA